MPTTLDQLITHSAGQAPDAEALCYGKARLNYAELAHQVELAAAALYEIGVAHQDRVAIYLPKTIETTVAIFASSMVGAIFVPINPQLKPQQVQHIIRDCGASVLITSADKARQIMDNPPSSLRTLLITQGSLETTVHPTLTILSWQDLIQGSEVRAMQSSPKGHDTAAILYTSGSTGSPKGVVLTQQNMVIGAQSVSQYLDNRPRDRILALLPVSFDYGLSQLTTAFYSQASVILLNYMLPREVLNLLKSEQITGLAAVPSLWSQLAQMAWPDGINDTLRYITNSGGSMPQQILNQLQKKLPSTDIFLMYGLTEAFRSTYLPPAELSRRPGSIGKAIPNAEVLVVNDQGTACQPGEEGELVHRGALVSKGYWQDSAMTATRFRPPPPWANMISEDELAVWSGDRVTIDDDGYIYFIGRDNDMIKSLEYRISPTEIEEVAYGSGLVTAAAAFGKDDADIGQRVCVAVTSESELTESNLIETLLSIFKQQLPSYMVPKEILIYNDLPHSPNGKIDRKRLAAEPIPA